MTEHAFGWLPSLPDFRDVPADVPALDPPDEVDLRDQMPPPYDQGQLGSCTANAVAGAVQFDAILRGEDFGTPSRLFIYYGERQREGTVDHDSGAFGRDGFKVVKHTGVPPESDWPYNIAAFADAPPAQAYTDAAQHQISRFTHVARSTDAWKRVLANSQTIAFGFTVYESFESEQVANTGIVPMPARTEAVLGGHEVLAVGYRGEYVLCRNSWGTEWGMGGYFLMPWAYAIGALSSDYRTIPR